MFDYFLTFLFNSLFQVSEVYGPLNLLEYLDVYEYFQVGIQKAVSTFFRQGLII